MLVMGVLLVLSTYKYKYTNFVVVDKENVPLNITTAAAADVTTAAVTTLILLAFAIQSKKA